jgi:hypothetical protein
MLVSMFRKALAASLMVALTACGGGDGGSTPPPNPPPTPTPTVTLALGSASGSLTAGNATTVTATITRGGGFTGPVTIAATGAPAGVTVTAGTIDAASTTQVVTITTTIGATAGVSTLSITGTASGVTITPASFALTINAAPAPGASIALSAITATVAAGNSTTVMVDITRSNGFTGPVTIGATGAPAGVTVTGGTAVATTNFQLVTIATTPGAAVGTVNITITGTAAGVTIAPASIALTVNAPLVGQLGNVIIGESASDAAHNIALSADGSRVVIGAKGNDDNGTRAGHARVYQYANNSWTQLGADLDGEAAEDEYGYSVAINDAGTRIAVGAYLNDGGGLASGHARVFDWNGSAWIQVGSDIDGSDNAPGAGATVAMSASGHRIVVGGPGRTTPCGEVDVYELISNVWTRVGARLAACNEYGTAVTMSDDGNRIAVGQPSAAGAGLPGTVYVYDWNGTSWALVGAAIVGEAQTTGGNQFGASLSMSGDGSMLAIGGTDNDGGGSNAGHVRVYRLVSGSWTQIGADLVGAAAGDFLGTSVALSGNGIRLIAGGRQAAQMYTLNGDTWTPLTTPTLTPDRQFGAGVTLSADGLVGAVGALGTNSEGYVRVYALPAP